MPFTSHILDDRRLKVTLWISIGLHLTPLVILPILGIFHGAPTPVRKTYLFDMVDIPRAAHAGARRAASAAAPEKKVPAPAPKKAAPQKVPALSSKKIAGKSAKAAPTPVEAAPEPAAEAPPAQDNGGDEALGNEMTVGKPGFPFHFYEQQIIAAVERNWRPPQELLGAGDQLVVVVKFEIQKDGRVVNLSIAESSWNNILDKLALRAIEKANLPPIPGEDQSLSITYRLVLKRA